MAETGPGAGDPARPSSPDETDMLRDLRALSPRRRRAALFALRVLAAGRYDDFRDQYPFTLIPEHLR